VRARKEPIHQRVHASMCLDGWGRPLANARPWNAPTLGQIGRSAIWLALLGAGMALTKKGRLVIQLVYTRVPHLRKHVIYFFDRIVTVSARHQSVGMKTDILIQYTDTPSSAARPI
jgi:hypothetical protein